MKHALPFLSMLVVMNSSLAYEPAASVESPDLRPVPREIGVFIKSDDSFAEYGKLNCSLKGKRVRVSSNPSASTWFVTTDNGCGWGAALGPIWLVDSLPTGKPSILLATGGDSIEALRRQRESYSDLVVTSETAGLITKERYGFRRGRYAQLRKKD
jgi:hypothetical protein